MVFDRKKIAILAYIGNTGTTKMVVHGDSEFESMVSIVNLQEGTWERLGRNGMVEVHLVGGRLRTDRFNTGIIGVYDCTQPSHMKLLVEEDRRARARRR